MTTKTALFLKLGVVMLSLMAAIAVYLFARSQPPGILAPLQATDAGLAGYSPVFGSAPSFFYTLALGLLIGICAPTAGSAGKHCIAWTGLALLLESSQHPSLAKPVSTFVHAISPDPIWTLVGPYWIRGAFDPLDLLATLIGGAVALILLGISTHENSDSISS